MTSIPDPRLKSEDVLVDIHLIQLGYLSFFFFSRPINQTNWPRYQSWLGKKLGYQVSSQRPLRYTLFQKKKNENCWTFWKKIVEQLVAFFAMSTELALYLSFNTKSQVKQFKKSKLLISQIILNISTSNVYSESKH